MSLTIDEVRRELHGIVSRDPRVLGWAFDWHTIPGATWKTWRLGVSFKRRRSISVAEDPPVEGSTVTAAEFAGRLWARCVELLEGWDLQ